MKNYPDYIKYAASIVPSARQLKWQENEMYAFIHFGMNTFTDTERGNGNEDPELFNPEELTQQEFVNYENMSWWKFKNIELMFCFFGVDYMFNTEHKKEERIFYVPHIAFEQYLDKCVGASEIEEYKLITGKSDSVEAMFALQHNYPKHWKTSPVIIETFPLNYRTTSVTHIVNGFRLFKERFGL